MNFKVVKGYYDSVEGKVKAGDVIAIENKDRVKELKLNNLIVEDNEDEEPNGSDWTKGLKKADFVSIYTEELGNEPEGLTVAKMIEEIEANRNA